MALSPGHLSATLQLTPGREPSIRVKLLDHTVPEPAEDPDDDYVIVDSFEAESNESSLDRLTIYDGLVYEERAASTKPIAELQSQLSSGKNSRNVELTLRSPPTTEEYDHLRSLRQTSRQLEANIHPLVVTEMRKLVENSNKNWDAKDKEILPRRNTSIAVSSIDAKHEGKPHPV